MLAFIAGLGAFLISAFPPITEATLAAFSDAWNQHDVDTLMSFMAKGCVFETAGFGTRHVGTEAVRRAVASAWQAVPDVQWLHGQHFVHGDLVPLRDKQCAQQTEKRTCMSALAIERLRPLKLRRPKAFRSPKPALYLRSCNWKSYPSFDLFNGCLSIQPYLHGLGNIVSYLLKCGNSSQKAVPSMLPQKYKPMEPD